MHYREVAEQPDPGKVVVIAADDSDSLVADDEFALAYCASDAVDVLEGELLDTPVRERRGMPRNL